LLQTGRHPESDNQNLGRLPNPSQSPYSGTATPACPPGLIVKS
jgi:hypothetical protein